MTRKLVLLTGTGLSLALAVGSAASAAPVKHKKVATASSSTQTEIEELRAEVKALTERLDAQAQAQQQTQTQVQQAQAAATQAQTQAQTATEQSTQAQTQATQVASAVPTQVDAAVAKLPKYKPGWWEGTTLGGRVFFDASHIDQESNGKNVDPTGTGFDIKRMYIQIDHKFNDIFSADLTTDFQYSSAISSTELYIKKAYLQATLNPALVIRVGSADLPWVPFVEDIYGYRYVENTLIDRTKFGTSADWGVHVGGKLANGIISYQVSAIDGSGYKAPLRSNHVDFEGRVSASYAGFTAAIGGYDGRRGADHVSPTDTDNTATREDALIAYTNKGLRLGGEWYHTHDWNSVAPNAMGVEVHDKSTGYGAFASYQLTPLIGVFGRYDWEKPNQYEAIERKDHYYNAGISFSPAKIVDLALVYKHDRVSNGTFSTSNGTIGGSDDGTYNEIGIFGQFRF